MGRRPPTATSTSLLHPPPPPPPPPPAPLYDQYNNDSGIGIVDQNFEPSFDIYDSEQGDDFVVPGGQTWNINQVDVAGVYFNGTGPADSINVVVYNDNGGLPGSVVASQPNLSYTDTSGGLGSYTIPLPSAITVGEGHYWVAVQPNMDFGSGGEWGWEGRTVLSNDPGVWRNPGDGFGTGCTDWAVKEVCIPSGEGPDQVWSISGTSGGPLRHLRLPSSPSTATTASATSWRHQRSAATTARPPFQPRGVHDRAVADRCPHAGRPVRRRSRF